MTMTEVSSTRQRSLFAENLHLEYEKGLALKASPFFPGALHSDCVGCTPPRTPSQAAACLHIFLSLIGSFVPGYIFIKYPGGGLYEFYAGAYFIILLGALFGVG